MNKNTSERVAKRKVSWNLDVPIPLDEAVEKVISSNFHLTKSEFIREAVREKLAKQGGEP